MEKVTFDNLILPLKKEVPEKAHIAFDEIFLHKVSDFQPRRGHFSLTDADQILLKATDFLRDKVVQSRPETAAEISQLWNDVCVDFHRNQYWGFSPTLKDNPHRVPLIQFTAVEKELFPYVWAFFQAAIAMKVVIYYFGIRASHESSIQNNLFVGFAILFSFSSLFFFAWRHHRKSHRKDEGARS